MFTDCHVHLWDLHTHEMSWPPPNNETLYKNYLLPEFLEASGKLPDRKCILVQVRQVYDETDWYLKFAEENDFIVGVVGWVDLKDEDGQLRKRLLDYKKNPYFCGVRHVVQDEPDVNWLLDERVLKGLGILEEMGVTYDLLILEKHMEVAEKIVKKFPRLTFVIDHLAKPSINKNDLDSWSEKMKVLAAYENIHCKISGLGDLADQSKCLKAQIQPYIKKTVELFGSERCLFGSDWPVCLQAISYTDWHDLVTSSLAEFSSKEQEDIMYRTAQRVYSSRI